MKEGDVFKGRGARVQPNNRYLNLKIVQDHDEGIDEPIFLEKPPTTYISTESKKALSKNDSPDLPLSFSVNPYQGCEHGCIYCYARNSHQYWGFDAGLGFETNILVKKNIVEQLKAEFDKKGYVPQPIMLSGNTDCYQPAEKKYELTRKILSLCLEYRHPVSIITKNSLVERDMDIIKPLASKRLVHVYFSINHLDKKLKLAMEPRTATAEKKFYLIKKFSENGIPCGIMVAPIIPGINLTDMKWIIGKAAAAGALKAGYTVVRLNGLLREVFQDWLEAHFPDRKDKVMHQIESLHGGKVNDTTWGRRITGEGPLASSIQGLFRLSVKRYLTGRTMPEYDIQAFSPRHQLKLFR